MRWNYAGQTPRKLALQDPFIRLREQYNSTVADAPFVIPDLVDLETLRCWNSGLNHETIIYVLAQRGWDATKCVDPTNRSIVSKKYRKVCGCFAHRPYLHERDFN